MQSRYASGLFRRINHVNDIQGITINVEEVKAKIGNAVTSIDLTRRKRILAEGKLFGV